MPPQIEKVLEDHVWTKTYDELRAFVIDNIGRWEKLMGGSQVHSLEPDSAIVLENEDGEIFPLERKAGNRFKLRPAPKKSPSGSPPLPRFAKNACYS